VTDLGIVIEVKDLHYIKTPDPIFVTESGIVIEVRELHI
jgi:hypothetical protein